MLLGIDLGSGGAKLTLMDTDGSVKAEAFCEYPTYYPKLGYSEQKPSDWWNALCKGVKSIKEKANIGGNDITAVCVDAPTHTSVLLGKNNEPLCDAIFWTDQRSIAEVKYLSEKYGEQIQKECLHTCDTIWTLPQLLWVKNNLSDLYSKVTKVLFEKDYIRYLLTGKMATDYIEAQGSMLFNANTGEWSEELCSLCRLPVSALPEILSPTDIAGKITKKAAQETGLSEGTPVIVGTTDTAMEVFGAGAVNSADATVKLATAGRICVITDRPYPNKYLINYPHISKGKWYPGTATRSAASAFRWYEEVFGDYENLLSESLMKNAYKQLDEAAEKIPVGSEGLYFHPYLMGELAPYNNSSLRASFVGATMKHEKAHFTRSVLEGVAYSLKDSLSVLTGEGLNISEARIIGGGAESPLWRQITADVLNIKLLKPKRSDSSFASAMIAGIGTGVFSNTAEAQAKCVKIESETVPNKENAYKYNKYFKIYKEIQQSLTSVYSKISTTM